MKKIWIILIAANLLASCTKEEFESPYLGDGTQIDIYLIKEGQIDYSYSQTIFHLAHIIMIIM